MPAETRRRSPAPATRTTSPRAGRMVRRTATPQRRGLAGGWLQRRQPEPSGVKKALSAVSRAFAGARSKKGPAAAAAGAALVTAGGLALRKRQKDPTAADGPTSPAPGVPAAGTENSGIPGSGA